ncbi:MAG: ribonuclease III [Deltaproteobacteria bacterium]|nr:ribonuclease III [Deltaproteobacteria bacterium]
MVTNKEIASSFPPEELHEIETALGYEFKDPDLLLNALTRRSFWHENRTTCSENNERMEFLGDSVLNLVIAHILYVWFPDAEEGELQKRRASLVKQHALARIMRRLCLADFIRMGKGDERSGCRERSSILADTVEAIIAAVFLDGGYYCAEKFISGHFRFMLDDLETSRVFDDPKSMLQERSQALMGITPVYVLLDETGAEHDRIFRMGVYIGDSLAAEGEGQNKKEAAQSAAGLALSSFDWPNTVDKQKIT